MTATQPSTTASDVVELFGEGSTARAALASWRVDPRYAAVVPRVERHIAKAVYQVTPGQLVDVCRHTRHALGTVRRTVAESLTAIVNWNPAFAFAHILHHVVEATGTTPTWSEFIEFFRTDPTGYAMLGRPIAEKRAGLVTEGVPADLVDDAIHWRVGNAYYSFLRELWIVANLRDVGLDIRMHPLADALFRVDAWHERTALIVYVGNNHFRDGLAGRKVRTEHILRDATPKFTVEAMRLKPAAKFGVVHLPPRDAIIALAGRLRTLR